MSEEAVKVRCVGCDNDQMRCPHGYHAHTRQSDCPKAGDFPANSQCCCVPVRPKKRARVAKKKGMA
jgi:hypothetical protein